MKTLMTAILALTLFATPSFAFAPSDARDAYLKEVQKPFEGIRGKLVRRSILDGAYYVLIDGVIYEAQLDDGRATTQRAKQCLNVDAAIFPSQLNEGCEVTFSGQGQPNALFNRSDQGSMTYIHLVLWDVEFH
jgi:hypothetical protein